MSQDIKIHSEFSGYDLFNYMFRLETGSVQPGSASVNSPNSSIHNRRGLSYFCN